MVESKMALSDGKPLPRFAALKGTTSARRIRMILRF